MEPRERELWQELRALESERRAAAAESGEPADRNLFERVKDFLGGER
jgi:hypothetical protein